MRELIRLYALAQADMTSAELEIALRHPAGKCVCLACEKFETYHRINTTIQAWEDQKLDLTRRNTPRRSRR